MGKFVKDGLTMEVSSVCENLFIKQGWQPFKDEPIVIDSEKEESIDSQIDGKEESELKTYSKRAFNGMSVDKILELAKEREYEITATEKGDIVEQFLALQDK